MNQITSKERDAETGLDYFGARYYSGTQGRFISPDLIVHPNQSNDSFVQFISEPSRWNKYSYVSNNPLKFVDLLGLERFLAIFAERPAPHKDVAFRDFVSWGHTSVGLVDTDNQTFLLRGFYPVSKLNPMFGKKNADGEIKSDDENLKLFDVRAFFKISDKTYDKLIKKLQHDADPNNTPKFSLTDFNCTDYAIEFAKAAGIDLPDPQGSFLQYGTGSNPNMFGNALEEYMIFQDKVEEDKLRELRKILLLGIPK